MAQPSAIALATASDSRSSAAKPEHGSAPANDRLARASDEPFSCNTAPPGVVRSLLGDCWIEGEPPCPVKALTHMPIRCIYQIDDPAFGNCGGGSRAARSPPAEWLRDQADAR